MTGRIIECVPNFSEGRDPKIIQQITQVIQQVDGVRLLDVDPGKATNRTVVTFVGSPEAVIEGAFQAIKMAASLIDMRHHSGEHPRMGATDVCPLIPIAGISLEETAQFAHKLAERVGSELHIPAFMYEASATRPERKNLATIRAGEYEGLEAKLKLDQWTPDYGPRAFNAQAGATVIGARDFLVAYNVNLNTTSVRKANSVAFDVRENGRVKTENGKNVLDEKGEPVRIPGKCKSVKAIGWYIEEYGIAQISMNLTNINHTPLHIAFDACEESAFKRGLRVIGSELVGMVPLKVLTDAGRHFLQKQGLSTGVSEAELIRIAIKSLGLDAVGPFDPQQKVIEYQMRDQSSENLVRMNLRAFADETASESPAPGGGSIAAYVGSLGASLATMVANLSANKKGWENQMQSFSDWAEQGQAIKDKLLHLVDADTAAFNGIMAAFQLPKSNESEIEARKAAIQDATKVAIQIPYEVMQTTQQSLPLIRAMVERGNPNSLSDAGVAALCARTAIHGGHLNVLINAGGYKDKSWLDQILPEAEKIVVEVDLFETEILEKVRKEI
ncbi:MAG: glutamate formimidoyltransferase [Saprospiraceae bacterium]